MWFSMNARVATIRSALGILKVAASTASAQGWSSRNHSIRVRDTESVEERKLRCECWRRVATIRSALGILKDGRAGDNQRASVGRNHSIRVRDTERQPCEWVYPDQREAVATIRSALGILKVLPAVTCHDPPTFGSRNHSIRVRDTERQARGFSSTNASFRRNHSIRVRDTERGLKWSDVSLTLGSQPFDPR